MTRARWIAAIVLLAAAVFAYAGGTYSERNYLALRRQEAEVDHRVKQLQQDIDSLRSFRDSLASNPVVQERVARESWGMLRPGELTFMIITDSGNADSASHR